MSKRGKFIETEGRLVVARGWGWNGLTVSGYEGASWAAGMFTLMYGDACNHLVELLTITYLFTWNEWILWYVRYSSIKLLKKQAVEVGQVAESLFGSLFLSVKGGGEVQSSFNLWQRLTQFITHCFPLSPAPHWFCLKHFLHLISLTPNCPDILYDKGWSGVLQECGVCLYCYTLIIQPHTCGMHPDSASVASDSGII